MAKVKGYYDVVNEEYIGIPRTAAGPQAQAQLMYSVRTGHGVCFGEFDTVSEEFVPETNPFVREFGKTLVSSESVDAFRTNQVKIETLEGGDVDKGAEVARKKLTPGTWAHSNASLVKTGAELMGHEVPKRPSTPPKVSDKGEVLLPPKDPNPKLIGLKIGDL